MRVCLAFLLSRNALFLAIMLSRRIRVVIRVVIIVVRMRQLETKPVQIICTIINVIKMWNIHISYYI